VTKSSCEANHRKFVRRSDMAGRLQTASKKVGDQDANRPPKPGLQAESLLRRRFAVLL
jgi:hypothetical protein